MTEPMSALSTPTMSTPPKLKSKSDLPWFVVILVTGVLTGLLLFTLGWYYMLPSGQKEQLFSHPETLLPDVMGFAAPKVFLVMGVDMPPRGSKQDYTGVRTDTMLLARLDDKQHRVSVVSIPRDSKVYIGQGVNKINAAFALGGPELSLDTVRQTFNVNVDNYLVVNLRGVKDFIDALGGMDLYVEKAMNYDDNTAKLHIHFQPGYHHLNGALAEGYLRFRHDETGDIGRIRRQQQFIAALSSKFKDPATLLKIPSIIQAMQDHILTNASAQDLIRLAFAGKSLDKSNIRFATMPGTAGMDGGVSYWLIHPQEAEAVLNQFIQGVEPSEDQKGIESSPKVGILYTAGYKAELPLYKETLTQAGFQVSCSQTVKKTVTRVVMHNTTFAKSVETALRGTRQDLAHVQLIFAPHGSTLETNACGTTDYTVILGEDTRRISVQ
jgi:LCP family protein required for cell wall assembly